jgi:hypothetical protein
VSLKERGEERRRQRSKADVKGKMKRLGCLMGKVE